MSTDVYRDRKGHPYPLQIGLRLHERLQAAVFYVIFQDVAAGVQVRRPGGVDEVSQALRDGGLAKDVEDEAWSYMGKHKDELQQVPYQSVVFQMFALWDWYVGKLHQFSDAALHELQEFPDLNGKKSGDWARFGFLSIENQIDFFATITGIPCSLSETALESLRELRLVRNLGIHNLWKVDEEYLSNSGTGPWETDEFRMLNPAELLQWQESLQGVVRRLSVETAKRFAAYQG
jgi:hypothetical protein